MIVINALKNQYSYPRNRNTIAGILGYIHRIEKASKAEIKRMMEA